MIMVICLANTVEYNEWKTGQRDEGLIFSLRPFTAKLASALMQFIVMLVYLIVGVTTYTNGISDAENAVPQGLMTSEEKMETINGILAEVPQAKKTALLVCMCVIPAVFVTVAIILYKKKFLLTEEFHAKIVREIAERKATEEVNADPVSEEK